MANRSNSDKKSNKFSTISFRGPKPNLPMNLPNPKSMSDVVIFPNFELKSPKTQVSTLAGTVVGALSALIEINQCSIKNIFRIV